MAGDRPRRSLHDHLGEPLQHPMRRRIVRVLNRRPLPRSAPEVAEEIGEDLEATEHHLRTLTGEGVVTQGRPAAGRGEPTYTSAVIGLPKVLALLEVTKAEDDEGRKAA